MPFIEQPPAEPGYRVPEGAAPLPAITPEAPSLVGPAFRDTNPVVNLYQMLRSETFPPDPAHNPLSVIRGTPYEERHLDNFLSSQSEGETRSIMRKIDEEDSDRRVLDEAGAAGTVAQLAAGLIDPTLLLPAGTIYRGVKGGYSIARSAASVGIAAGLQSTASELALQAGQETRTAGQSTAAIASSVLLAGLIGAGASKLLSNVERTALETALDVERVAVAAHASGVPPPSVGRAQPAGAAASDVRQLEMEFSGLGFSDRLSPTRRTLNASEVEPRRIMADLAETPYRFKENEEGVATTQGPSVDRMVRTETNAARVHIADELDRQFAEYRFNDADASVPRLRAQFERLTGANEGKMSFAEFKKEVSRAAMSGDQHATPQVAAAAQFIRRRAFDPWAERAENAIEGFQRGQQAEGESYFPHVWKKELITARRPEFTNRLVEKYQADQTAKRGAQGRISALNDELQDVGGKLAKASEDAAPDLKARYDDLRNKMEEEIGAWEGKSSKEAKAALKAREKAAADRADDAPRLRAADAAIDKAVKRILEADQDLSVQELRAVASQTVDRILGSPDGRLPYDLSSGPAKGAGNDARGALAARRLNVTNAWAAEWIEDDIERVATTHMRTVVPDVILTERFGDVDMTEAMRRINESYAQRIDTTKSEKQRVELGKEREAVIRDIAAVRDRVRGVYGYAPELKNMARVAGAVKNLNNLQSMGMAAVSSLPDLAGAVFRFGLTNTLRDGWAPFISNMVRPSPEWLKFKSQMRAIGIGIESATNARQHAIDDVMDVYQPQSRFERTLQGASDKFFIANMLAPLTDVQKTIASHVAVSEILRAAVTISKGKGTKRLVGNLAESGIDVQMAGRIAEQFKAGGEVTNGVHLPNTADWTDRAAADALNGAVAREVDIAVVTPGQEKPLWMSHPVLSVLGQFKAFTASATERILIANLQRRDANVLSGMVASVALGMMSYKVNSLLGGQKTSDRPQDWIKEGISKGGLLGWFEEGNALASKMTRGGVDMYRMIGADKPLSRYASRSTLDMFLGPTAGKVQALSQATGAAVSGEWSESDTKAVRKLTVFQNLFWLRNALNQVERGINGAAGVEMKAP
jgi:hypothetical protein